MPAVIDYIEKQQNMPLEIRDWSKANRYQEAYEFITNTGNDLSSSATFGDSSMIQNKSLLIDVLCSYLEEAEERKIVAESLRAELIRLNQLNAGALTWEAHLCEKQQTTQAYLNELLGVKNVSDDKTEQKFLSQNQMTKDSLVERGIAKRNELTNSTALLSALESQYGKYHYFSLRVLLLVVSGHNILSLCFFAAFVDIPTVFPLIICESRRKKERYRE